MNKQEVDLLVLNGHIQTVDEGMRVFEAMAIENGVIKALGSSDEIESKFKGEILDLQGQFVYPGFIDPHCHFLRYGESTFYADLLGAESFEEVISRLQKFDEEQEQEWLLGYGWDQNLWDEKKYPNKGVLDSLYPDRPVYLIRVDLHAALVNQKALDLARISADFEIDGGKVLIDNGQPTGILIDNAMNPIKDILPQDFEHKKKAALLAQQECFKYGLTSVGDAYVDQSILDVLLPLYESADLQIRMNGMAVLEEDGLDWTDLPMESGRFKMGAVKYFADGALGSRGAALIDDYTDEPGNKGILIEDKEYFLEQARLCYLHGLQMNVHAIGDSANRLILSVMAEVLGESNDRRWRVEHCQVMHPNDFDYFKEYSIIPSVQAAHATSDMDWVADRLGPDRAAFSYANKSLLQSAGIIVNGSDFPVEGVNPLLGFYAAVTRQKPEGSQAFFPEQTLSREEALKAMTIWAAYAAFEENNLGSLEVGKRADFVILDMDLLNVSVEQIPTAEVVSTYLSGQAVFNK